MEYQGFEYQASDEDKDTWEITGYNGSETNVVIPNEIDGKAVEHICLPFWHGSEGNIIESITIPASVRGISYSPSYDADGLFTSINVDSASAYYSSVDGVLYDKEKTELMICPSGKKGTLEVPDGVTNISWRAFAYSRLTNIELPSGITSIEAGAFLASGISTMEIPSGVTEIQEGTFSMCSGLRYIGVPESVSYIDPDAFKLIDDNIKHDIIIYGEKNSYAAKYAKENNMKFSTGSLPKVMKNADCEYIDYFDGTIELRKYTGTGTDADVSKLVEGKTVTSIGGRAFYGCSNLTSIEIPSSVTSIGGYAFYGCNNLTSIEIPSSVTSIGDYAFYGCSNLTSIEIPSGVTSIGDYAFYGCSNLTSIEIPSSVTSMDEYFFGCSRLESINVDRASKSYSSEDGILYNKNKTKLIRCPEGRKGNVVIIPTGVTDIGLFQNCKNLTSVTIPPGVTRIGENVFLGCTSLTNVTIPMGVTRIGNGAFGECTSLTSITIPSSVTGIYHAFDSYLHTIYGEADSFAEQYAMDCNIKFVATTVPKDPTTSEQPTTPVTAPKVGDTFKDTKSKAQYKITGKQTVSYIKTTATSGKVTIPATVTYKNKTYKVTAIYKAAFKNKTGITAVTFGKNITSVGSEAFSGCKKLKTVTLNKNLTKIGDKAFYNCKVLTQIKLGSKVTTIGKSAFAGCTKLKKVTLGTGLTTIGDSAFNKCTALTAVTIPSKVKKIGEQAFYGCKKLKSITIKTIKLKSSNVGANAFKGIYAKATVKVPKNKKAAYKKLIKSKGAGRNVKYK
ncbi:MAG: leucine-rich repeat domain-containing protein [Muribaculaceae bacterium]|nr:leucine-rich repeat domain-containing protein [Muribaculaceae bacterium]MCM1400313.1 leucine-rich repeat domain-containing protein [Clostridium sp.]MCM1461008.1 leucine-rich repeat domain-containing protein [Bacteroides sp.]